MRTYVGLIFWMVSATLRAQIACPCNPQDPETLKERQCALCAEAEKQSAGTVVFFVQDSSPRKPDRWLAIPRQHSPGMHHMDQLPADVRAELWRSAIAKAKELWGENWGIAYNAEKLHSQCHVHIHVGKLIDGVEWGEFKVVDGPEQIPLPGPDGLWIHPVNGKLHVHIGEQVAETVLLR
jgi:diadenosine tetraphosphate (Ap4A) HIT family hydrolase